MLINSYTCSYWKSNKDRGTPRYWLKAPRCVKPQRHNFEAVHRQHLYTHSHQPQICNLVYVPSCEYFYAFIHLFKVLMGTHSPAQCWTNTVLALPATGTQLLLEGAVCRVCERRSGHFSSRSRQQQTLRLLQTAIQFTNNFHAPLDAER